MWRILGIMLVSAGCVAPTSEEPAASDLMEGSTSIQVQPTGEPVPVTTDSFVFEERYETARTEEVLRTFTVRGGGEFGVSWWRADSGGGVEGQLVAPFGEEHLLSFGPDDVQGQTSVPVENGQWQLRLHLQAFSGLVHVSVQPTG